jgi:signal transduction histidine kinase
VQQTETVDPARASVGSLLETVRLRRLDHGLVLAVLAAAVGFAAEASGFAGARWPLAVLAVVAAIAAVAVRGRWPLEMTFVVAAAVVAAPGPGLLVGAGLVAVYSVAARLGRRDTAIAGLSLGVAFLVERAAWGFADDVLPPLLLGVAVAAAVGLYVGVRRASAVERERLEHAQETLVAERTAADERVRIARELHDVVAHTLSLIVVQSEVLGRQVEGEELRGAATALAELGRAAMGELHRTLDLLRGGDEPAEREPQPSLSDLATLVHQACEGGLTAELIVAGQPRPLPAGVEVSAFRIVQEALTNVRRHAAASRVEVRLRYATDALELSVEDDGAGTDAEAAGEGHGLRGMHERAAMLGGVLSVGPLDAGGYRVSAILPYAEAI